MGWALRGAGDHAGRNISESSRRRVTKQPDIVVDILHMPVAKVIQRTPGAATCS